MVPVLPRSKAHDARIEQPMTNFTHPEEWLTPWYQHFLSGTRAQFWAFQARTRWLPVPPRTEGHDGLIEQLMTFFTHPKARLTQRYRPFSPKGW